MLSLIKAKIESIFETDRFDLLNWRDATDILPQAIEEDRNASQTLGGHPVQDGFLSLYKTSPKLISPPPSGLEPLSELFQKGMTTPNWQRLKTVCTGDSVASIVGSVAFVKEILTSLPNDVKDEIQKVVQETEKENQLHRNLEALKSLLEAVKEQGLSNKELEESVQEVESQLVQQRIVAEDARSKLQRKLANNESKVVNVLNQSAGKAVKPAKETTDFIQGFSLASGSSPTLVRPDVARKAIEVLKTNPNLNKLADMLGWARRMVKAEWRKSPHSRTEFVGYRIHELQIENIAPSELTRMIAGEEILELDFLKRVSDGEISHRHFEGKERKGRGPLILVRDESGSMSGAKHSLAVALEWALLEIAKKDQREFFSIPFSGAGEFYVWKAPDKPDPESVVKHLSHFYGGGTEPYRPLMEALQILESGNLRADILLLTDANFGNPDSEFIEKVKKIKTKRPMRIVTVVIGGGTAHKAERFSDRVIFVEDLIQDKEYLRRAVREVV